MYWHFATMKDGVPVMRDGTPIEIGKRYILPKAKMCKRGFHGSPTPLDALQYAPGAWVSRREIVVTDKDKDKVVGTSCVHMVGADATEVLSKFARMCALDVVHLWDAPDVVVRYLNTGDESLRDAARDAAWAAERDATGAKQNKRLTRMLNKLLKETV